MLDREININYRGEIDGLRAIAVLAVICYHLELNIFHSGFAGVDMFFVISGYLVGGHILHGLRNSSFKFPVFFYSRAKRILPALYVMICISFALGYFTMMPVSYQYFGGAAFTSIFAVSNFWFFDQINYFNPAASIDPLVHTWSLGVEEQFYLAAPILLVLINKIKPSFLVPFIIIIFTGSLSLSIFYTAKFPEAAFYLTHTRAWEFALGILVWIFRHQEKWLATLKTVIENYVSYFGLWLILVGIWFIPTGADWPGYLVLVPTVGISFILLDCSSNNFVYKFLNIGAVRFVGVISYSLYLWHQPVISFLKITNNYPATIFQKLLTLTVIVIISILSWFLIERPFRKQIFGVVTNKMIIFCGFVAILSLAVGGHITKGYPERLPKEVLEVFKTSSFEGEANKRCMKSRKEVEDLQWDDICQYNDHPVAKNVLWGDSHGGSIADALGKIISERDEGLEIVTLSSCLPITNLINHTQTRATRCPEFNAKAADYIVESKNIENVYMFATWDIYFTHGEHPDMFGITKENLFYSYPIYGSPYMDENDRISKIILEFSNLINRLIQSGKTVYVIKSIPRPNVSIPTMYAQRLWGGTPLPASAGYPKKYFTMQRQITDFIFEEVQKKLTKELVNRLHILDPAKNFCDEELCYIIRNGNILYSDGNHLSVFGAGDLIRWLKE